MSEKGLSDFFSVVGPLLDERQRRLVAGATARLLGRGGSTAVARAGKMSRTTVITGTKEIADGKTAPRERLRRPGGGRRANIDKQPELLIEL